MTKRPKPLIYPDSVRPPPTLPDAQRLRDMEAFDLTDDEFQTVRIAMAIHSASRQPKLTWVGWKQIAIALQIGARHAKKLSKGATDTPLYIRPYSEFLKKSGLHFLNHNDRAAAVRLLPYWDEIDEWRATLSQQERARLNNPREVWDTYVEHQRKLGDPDIERRPARPRTKRQGRTTLLEEYEALQELVETLTEQRDLAERQLEYFAEMADAIAQRAKLDEADIAEIRNKIRAAHESE